jgi:CheY-like chemotaxis protein
MSKPQFSPSLSFASEARAFSAAPREDTQFLLALGRALVVDDSKSFRTTMRDLLGELGLATIEASSGLEAIHLLANRRDILVVFLDLQMPGIDGLSLIERLAADAAKKERRLPPFILLSSQPSRETVLRAKLAGAVAWIMKPPRKDQIAEIIARIAT